MREHIIGVDDKGRLQFIDNPELAFLRELGKTEVKRASHVEPDSIFLRPIFHILRYCFGETGSVASWTRNWKCNWRVDMRPSNGPILDGRWSNRQQALDAEVQWLNENFI